MQGRASGAPGHKHATSADIRAATVARDALYSIKRIIFHQTQQQRASRKIAGSLARHPTIAQHADKHRNAVNASTQRVRNTSESLVLFFGTT